MIIGIIIGLIIGGFIMCMLQINHDNELQRRIDKAIRYIDSKCLKTNGYAGNGYYLIPAYLIKILKGKSHE